MGLFDFSNPARRAKEILIKNAKKSMISAIVSGIILGIAFMISLSNVVDSDMGILPIIIGLIPIVISIFAAISIRNSTFYRLAILEACEVIKNSSQPM